MMDIVQEIEAVQREVASGRTAGGEGRALRLRRTYAAPIDDVWDALTNPSRLTRWFLPISGDYRIGGRYQLEGNAGGEILACERPTMFKVTWAYGEAASTTDISELEVRLEPVDGDTTLLELEHVAIVPDEMWDQFGPGAVGVGWDQGLAGLAAHLRGESLGDPAIWPTSDEARVFSARSSEAWGEANRVAGATDEAVARGVTNSTAFCAPERDTV